MKKDWKQITQLGDILLQLAGEIKQRFTNHKVGLEIVEWCAGEGITKFRAAADNFVSELILAFRASTEKTKEIVKRVLTPWRTITVGGTTTEALTKAIEEKKGTKEKNEVGDYARDIMGKDAFVVASKPEQVDLVILTPADFGFTAMPRTDEFLTKKFLAEWSAKHLEGCLIELCEPEDGAQLRLQYQDQPKGEVLWIAMERITGSDGHPDVFRVERHGDGRRWLDAHWVYPYAQWSLGARLVFRLRKFPLPLPS